jgi:hypothetical protein
VDEIIGDDKTVGTSLRMGDNVVTGVEEIVGQGEAEQTAILLNGTAKDAVIEVYLFPVPKLTDNESGRDPEKTQFSTTNFFTITPQIPNTGPELSLKMQKRAIME